MPFLVSKIFLVRKKYVSLQSKKVINNRNMAKCVISNSGESICRITRELTDEQYHFLDHLFNELNDAADGSYAPYVSIYKKSDE